MSFIYTPDSKVLAKKGKRGAKAKPKVSTTVWEDYALKTKENVRTSLAQIIGRYGDKGLPPTPYKNYKGSASWTVKNKANFSTDEFSWMNDDKDREKLTDGEKARYAKHQDRIKELLADETVVIKVKVGGQPGLPMFPKYDAKNEIIPGETSTELNCSASEAVGEMKRIAKMVEGMARGDGGLGDFFHAAALKQAKKAREKGKAKYSTEYDCFYEPEDKAEMEAFFAKKK